jgi:hypothetical protein
VTGLETLATQLTSILGRLKPPEPTWMEPLLDLTPRTAAPAAVPTITVPPPVPVRRRRRAPAKVGLLLAAVGALALGALALLWPRRPAQTAAMDDASEVASAPENSQAQREQPQPVTQPAAESAPNPPPAVESAPSTPPAPQVQSVRPASPSPALAKTPVHHPRPPQKKERGARTSDSTGSTARGAGRSVDDDRPEPDTAAAAQSEEVSEPASEASTSPEPAPPPASAPPKAAVAPRPRAQTAPTGSVDRGQIRDTVASHMAEVRTCFERARVITPRVAGTVTVRIALAPDGKVVSADVASDTTASPQLQGCLSERIRSWSFPAFGRRSIVMYPFRFE